MNTSIASSPASHQLKDAGRIIILASHNAGKVRELRRLLPNDRVLSLADLSIPQDIEETGTTFLENARLKALGIKQHIDLLNASLPREAQIPYDYVLSDDSGLEIDFFDKKPGVYSSRWLGEDTPYEEKNRQILEMMADVPFEQRTARYVCALSCLSRDGLETEIEETAEGYIASEPKGTEGFGYDPIFYFPPLGTFAEIPLDIKNLHSHRGKALARLVAILNDAAADAADSLCPPVTAEIDSPYPPASADIKSTYPPASAGGESVRGEQS